MRVLFQTAAWQAAQTVTQVPWLTSRSMTHLHPQPQWESASCVLTTALPVNMLLFPEWARKDWLLLTAQAAMPDLLTTQAMANVISALLCTVLPAHVMELLTAPCPTNATLACLDSPLTLPLENATKRCLMEALMEAIKEEMVVIMVVKMDQQEEITVKENKTAPEMTAEEDDLHYIAFNYTLLYHT